MKKVLAITMIGMSMIMATGCNSAAKNFGGTITLNLPKGEKLEMITWKDDSLWYLTRPMREGESAETYTYQEDTNFGIMEGKVIIVEKE